MQTIGNLLKTVVLFERSEFTKVRRGKEVQTVGNLLETVVLSERSEFTKVGRGFPADCTGLSSNHSNRLFISTNPGSRINMQMDMKNNLPAFLTAIHLHPVAIAVTCISCNFLRGQK